MKKRILAVTLALCTFTCSAFAEQAAAEKYRTILQSGKYYVEYEIDVAKKMLAVADNKRMDYTSYKKSGGSGLAMGLALINPLLAIGSMFGGSSKAPTVYYEDGKYYQFEGKKKALLATEQQLNDPNIDPSEGWGAVKYNLALPEELAVFAPNDMFYQKINGATQPTFVESGTIMDGKKEIAFDKYSSSVKSMTGKELYAKSFYMYYAEGELKEIKSYISYQGGKEELIRTVEVKTITDVLPENILKIPEGCKVYSVGLGDMSDLIEQPAQLEAY